MLGWQVNERPSLPSSGSRASLTVVRLAYMMRLPSRTMPGLSLPILGRRVWRMARAAARVSGAGSVEVGIGYSCQLGVGDGGLAGGAPHGAGVAVVVEVAVAGRARPDD